ncbi:aromatic-ring-hydroxylating dioxygenase subunit beta [Burkholderia gladioli]|uniref:aromatic-ring-hydroxylating dioxygenase subunit beta n=1 Tax=Burkholderia gladioli TaxID=28095 RepID=UPI003D2335D0
MRARRVSNARNWSQQPPTRTARLVGNVMLDGRDAQGRWSCIRRWWSMNGGSVNARSPGSSRTARHARGLEDLPEARRPGVNSTDAFANLEVFV